MENIVLLAIGVMVMILRPILAHFVNPELIQQVQDLVKNVQKGNIRQAAVSTIVTLQQQEIMYPRKVQAHKLLVTMGIIKMKQENLNVSRAQQAGRNQTKGKRIALFVVTDGINQTQGKDGVR